MNMNVRPMQLGEIEKVVDYFLNSDAEFLKGMGADFSKLPKRADWLKKLELEWHKPYARKGIFLHHLATR